MGRKAYQVVIPKSKFFTFPDLVKTNSCCELKLRNYIDEQEEIKTPVIRRLEGVTRINNSSIGRGRRLDVYYRVGHVTKEEIAALQAKEQARIEKMEAKKAKVPRKVKEKVRNVKKAKKAAQKVKASKPIVKAKKTPTPRKNSDVSNSVKEYERKKAELLSTPVEVAIAPSAPESPATVTNVTSPQSTPEISDKEQTETVPATIETTPLPTESTNNNVVTQ